MVKDKYLFLKIIGIGFIFLLFVILALNLYYNSQPKKVYIDWVESFPDENVLLRIRFKVVNPFNIPYSGYFMVRHDCLDELNKNIISLAITKLFGEKIYNTKIPYTQESEWNCKFQSQGTLTIYKEVEDMVTDHKNCEYKQKENITN